MASFRRRHGADQVRARCARRSAVFSIASAGVRPTLICRTPSTLDAELAEATLAAPRTTSDGYQGAARASVATLARDVRTMALMSTPRRGRWIPAQRDSLTGLLAAGALAVRDPDRSGAGSRTVGWLLDDGFSFDGGPYLDTGDTSVYPVRRLGNPNNVTLPNAGTGGTAVRAGDDHAHLWRHDELSRR